MSDTKIQNQEKPSRLWRILSSAELPLFFYTCGLMMHMPILLQYVYLRFSIQENFPYNFSAHQTSCGGTLNRTVRILQEKVQEQSSQFQIALSLCNTLPSLLVCLIYGSWSDRVGRKPLIVLGMCGALLDTVCVFFTILLDLPLSVMLFGSFLNGIGGYLTGLFLAVMAYVADTTGREDRPLRLGVFKAVVFLGSTIGYFSCGHLIRACGFKNSYIVVVSCHCAACFCSCFLMKESLPGKKPSLLKSMFSRESLKYPLQAWHVLVKPRPYKWKIGIMLPANLFANVLPLGINSVITLYVLNSPFCLPSIQVGYFKGIQFTVLGIGAAIGIKLLRSCFPPHIISMFGILSYAAFYTTLSFARTVTMLYVAVAIGAVSGAVGPIYRSILSQAVGPNEQGALFSAALSLEMLSVFIVTFIFNAVYPIANDAGYPGATFYLVDLFLLIPLVLNLIYAIKIRSEASEEELENIISETVTNPREDNATVCRYGSSNSTPPIVPAV